MLIPKGALVVSCQARADNPLHGPVYMSAMAQAAEAGGALGIRANGARASTLRPKHHHSQSHSPSVPPPAIKSRPGMGGGTGGGASVGRSMSHSRGQSAAAAAGTFSGGGGGGQGAGVCPQDLMLRNDASMGTGGNKSKRKRASWDGGLV